MFQLPILKDYDKKSHEWLVIPHHQLSELRKQYRSNVKQYCIAYINYYLRQYVNNFKQQSGLTWGEIANLSGVRADMLSRWLKYKHDFNFANIAKLERFLQDYVEAEGLDFYVDLGIYYDENEDFSFEESYNPRTFQRLRGREYVR